MILENATSPVMNNASGEFLLEVSRTLIITDTEDGDSGNYSCQTVSDPRLEVNTVTFDLLVQGQYPYCRQLSGVLCCLLNLMLANYMLNRIKYISQLL